MALFLAFLLFLFINRPILASDNVFGLHLTQTSDINSAGKIINSSGGDWGWATIVIRLDQQDHNTWQEFFDKCRRQHIIPIIRLATIMDSGYWKAPATSDIDGMVSFLNSLNWPEKNRYIILYNEPNHADEWSGKVDAKNYADMAIYASEKLKQTSPDYVVLSGALDLASPQNPPQFESAAVFYKEIYTYRPEYFEHIDAVASHSYPNHGFIGTPNESGQHSVRGYVWELDYIKSLGVSKKYDVYITETGWPHFEGDDRNNHFYTMETSAKFLKASLDNWQQDKRVQAVTPFIYNYPYPPFDHFSWVDKNENLFPQYQPLIDMAKGQNKVIQETSYEYVRMDLPLLILKDSDYLGELVLKNTGQSIWGETKFCLNPNASANLIVDSICVSDSDKVNPGEMTELPFKFKVKNIADFTGKSFIGWESMPPTEINTFNPNALIYGPPKSIRDRLTSFFYSFFI